MAGLILIAFIVIYAAVAFAGLAWMVWCAIGGPWVWITLKWIGAAAIGIPLAILAWCLVASLPLSIAIVGGAVIIGLSLRGRVMVVVRSDNRNTRATWDQVVDPVRPVSRANPRLDYLSDGGSPHG